MTVHPQILITSCNPTSDSAHNVHFATYVPRGSDMWLPWWLRQERVHHAMQETWVWSMRGVFVRATHHKHTVQEQEGPESEALDSELLRMLGPPLGSSLERCMGAPVSHILVLPLAFPSLWSGSPHEEDNLQLSSAFLSFSYLFSPQTQKPGSRDGTINLLKPKNKTWYFHKATKKKHWVWLSYSPEFSPEVGGKESYISQHGHSIHLYDWKRMFLFALHYTHKFHPLSKSNYCWPPKYIKFGFKSVTFEDILQPTS